MSEVIYRPNVNIKHFIDESGLSQCTIEVNCSKCGIKLTRHCAQTAEDAIKSIEEFATNYCHNCGAKLREPKPERENAPANTAEAKLYPTKYKTNVNGKYALIKKGGEIFLIHRKAKDTNYYYSQILCTDETAEAFKKASNRKNGYPCINREEDPKLFDEWTKNMQEIFYYQFNNNRVGEKE